MVVEIVWTEPAVQRLREISDYYTKEGGVHIARKIRERIVLRAEILSTNPYAGQREELLRHKPEEFRYLVVGNFKIVYWTEQNKAMISTVFDCRQNPEKMREEIK